MDTKQLITGSPKEGFYPIVQDTVTVIELNKAVLSLTSESSSEDIIAAFDSAEDFTTLLQNVRNTENIVNGVLVNDSSLVGKIFCNIVAHPTQETLYIDGVFTNQYFNIIITNTDGTFSCTKNVVYLNREIGDKTNVLILSLENDLANGQKDSPVTAEISTALKDAISTGKACVIKSANSDILANLQQISDNVTIVMEQISRVGQTFVAVNTTITVNTATNVISDYQTGAIVLETEGDGSKFLSNDGSYKEINDIYYIDANPGIAAGLEGVRTALANNKLPVFKHLYEGKPAYELSPAICNFSSNGQLVSYTVLDSDNITVINISSTDEITTEQIPLKQVEKVTINAYVGSTIPIEQFEKLQVIGGTKVILIDDPDEGYYSIPATVKGITDKEIEYIYKGQYNKISIDNSYNVTKETKDLGGDLSNYLAKNNTTEFTPTGDYNPATKKYVDEVPFYNANFYYIGVQNVLATDGQLIYRIPSNYKRENIDLYAVFKESVEFPDNRPDKATFDGPEYTRQNISIPFYTNLFNGSTANTSSSFNINTNKGILNIHCDIKYDSKFEDGSIPIYAKGKWVQRILTESEYSALGTTPETDNVLYFVTPD